MCVSIIDIIAIVPVEDINYMYIYDVSNTIIVQDNYYDLMCIIRRQTVESMGE